MSKNLARLLSKPHEELGAALAKLEAVCGYPSEDVRLLAENKQKLRAKLSHLGLDPDDTTDKELYYALLARFERDSGILDRALGIHELSTFGERLDKADQLVSQSASVDEMWLLKNSVAKAILTATPPTRLIKKLHYRTVSSLIKREDIAEIYLAAAALESGTWQKNMNKQIAKQSSTDYELRPIKVLKLSPEAWADVKGPSSHLVSDSRIGAVAIWPTSELKNASILSLSLTLLSGVQSMNPDGYFESLHHLNPALSWWADNQYLVADGARPVSLNLKDVATNHLKRHDIKDATTHHGGHSLWHELEHRYQQISANLSGLSVDFEGNLDGAGPPLRALPMSSELATEYITVEE